MRLKHNRLKTVYLYQAQVVRDAEGGKYNSFADPKEVKAETWAGVGDLQQEMYGKTLPNIRNFRLDGSFTEEHEENGKTFFTLNGDIQITAGDGISLSGGTKPEYIIKAIYPYRWLTIEAEAVTT